MNAQHKTMIHARCPYAPVWDYYEVTFTTEKFLRCELLQSLCDQIRGQEVNQEQVFAFIQEGIKIRGTLVVEGQHGTNGRLVISGDTTDCRFPGDAS